MKASSQLAAKFHSHDTRSSVSLFFLSLSSLSVSIYLPTVAVHATLILNACGVLV